MPQIDLGQVVGPPGQDGADGQDGAPGAAAAITGASASATTLSAGSSATAAVTANGTDASRSFAFSFGIPKGDKGDTGAAGPSKITTSTETTITGLLKGNGTKVSAAVSGTDYGTYSKPAGGIPTSDLASVDSYPDSAHTSNLITSEGVANALAREILYYTGQTVSAASNAQIMRIPASGTDDKITTDTIVLDCVFAHPEYIAGNVTWQSYAGYIAFTGTCSTATTAQVTLGRKGN